MTNYTDPSGAKTRAVSLPFLIGAFAILGPGAAMAQAVQNLATLPGSTEFQARVGAAIQTACGQLGAAGTNRNGPSDREDLFGRCQDMVHTANALRGSGATTNSLGIGVAELQTALNGIGHDEAAAQGANSSQNNDVQIENLSGRLAAVRSGARGVSTAGLSLYNGSQVLTADERAWLGNDLAAGEEAAETTGRLGVFVTGDYSFGEDDGSSEEAGYDFDGYGITAGADYRVSENFIAGAAFGYTAADNDFDGNNGDLQQDTYSFSVYGSVFSGAFYVDGVIGYAFSDSDLDRRVAFRDVATGGARTINRIASSSTDGEELTLGVGAGYEFSQGGFSLSPYLRADYADTNLDGYRERGARGLDLAVGDQDFQSFETTLGADVSYAHSTGFGILLPSARLEWAHEYDNDSRRIGAQYVNDPNANRFFVRTDSPDRNYYTLSGGLSALMAGGMTAFAELETVLGREDYERHTIRVGGRLEF